MHFGIRIKCYVKNIALRSKNHMKIVSPLEIIEKQRSHHTQLWLKTFNQGRRMHTYIHLHSQNVLLFSEQDLTRTTQQKFLSEKQPCNYPLVHWSLVCTCAQLYFIHPKNKQTNKFRYLNDFYWVNRRNNHTCIISFESGHCTLPLIIYARENVSVSCKGRSLKAEGYVPTFLFLSNGSLLEIITLRERLMLKKYVLQKIQLLVSCSVWMNSMYDHFRMRWNQVAKETSFFVRRYTNYCLNTSQTQGKEKSVRFIRSFLIRFLRLIKIGMENNPYIWAYDENNMRS